MMKIRLLFFALLLITLNCCCVGSESTGGSGSKLISLSSPDNGKHVAVAVGQGIEITLHTVGPQQYGAPEVSTAAVRYESVALKMPPNPSGATQVLRFQAVSE